jgi:hypothetical protein
MSSLKSRIFAVSMMAVMAAAIIGLGAIFPSYKGMGIAAAANSGSTNVIANVVVPGVCEVGLAPTQIAFGSYAPNVGSPTSNGITDTNNGNLPSYLYVYGTTWTYASNTFAVGQTDWNPISLGSFGGNALTASPVNSLIPVANGGSNSIYFGVFVPTNTPAGTYNQNIIILNTC